MPVHHLNDALDTSSEGTITTMRLAALLISMLVCGACSSTKRASFETPDAAMEAFVTMVQTQDSDLFDYLFGSNYRGMFDTEDPALDEDRRQKLLAAAAAKKATRLTDDNTAELFFGNDEWPFPIPVVRDTASWSFDTEAGMSEIQARQIGWNELEALQLCRELLDIQHTYKHRDWDEDGILEFASQMNATPGTFDGLYWEHDHENDIPCCPLHDFVERNREYIDSRKQEDPWRGYLGKVLTQQGTAAKGGAMDYMVDGSMTKGFAALIWPAEYGQTGMMSFLVSHHGVVYEKDLGSDTATLAESINSFNPGDGWTVSN